MIGKNLSEGLSRLLADRFVLYMKTHNFHWNVEGPMFNEHRKMFMDEYTELWNALDPIAERIRSLGHYAPASYKKYVQLSSITASEKDTLNAKDMVKQLLEGHETVVKTARDVFPLAEAGADEATQDLLTLNLLKKVDTKNVWGIAPRKGIQYIPGVAGLCSSGSNAEQFISDR